MKIGFHFLLSLSFILGFSMPSFAEHEEGSPGNGVSTRQEDNLRIIRTKGRTTIKEMTKNGIQNTFIRKGEEPRTTAWSLTDFTSEKVSCTDGKGRLIVAYVADNQGDNLKSVIKAAEASGFKVVEVVPFIGSMLVQYDCNKVTLGQIQKLYFNKFVEYIEPDVKVSGAGASLE